MVSVFNGQSMRVGSQYWEVLKGAHQAERRRAERRQSGSIDLFLVAAPVVPLRSALGPNPVMSSPADASQPEWIRNGTESWYLRRASGTAVLIAPADFANQVARLLHDAPVLARRVATSQAGYRYENLESIIQQYNQVAHN